MKDEFPCKVCKKLFSSIFSIKTHIYVAHRKYLKPAQAGAVVKKTGADYKKGFKSKNAYLTRKKFTHRKQKPWCKYCWVRFPNRDQQNFIFIKLLLQLNRHLCSKGIATNLNFLIFISLQPESVIL